MARMKWNAFVQANSAAPAFTAQVSAQIPNGPLVDKNQKIVPTPYALFCEWLAQNLQGDWTSRKFPGGFVVRATTAQDQNLLLKQWPPRSSPTKTQVSSQTVQISYTDGGYATLARQLGYVI